MLTHLYESILSRANARVQSEAEIRLQSEVANLNEKLRITEEHLRIKESEGRIQREEIDLLSAVNARNISRVRAETAKLGLSEGGMEPDAEHA